MGGVFDLILQLLAVRLLRLLVYMGRWVCEWRLLSERVGEKEINDDLMWHVFDLHMCYVPRVLHLDKYWRKLKSFEQEGSRTQKKSFTIA